MPRKNQRLRVWRGEIRKTTGGLTKDMLMKNKKVATKTKKVVTKTVIKVHKPCYKFTTCPTCQTRVSKQALEQHMGSIKCAQNEWARLLLLLK